MANISVRGLDEPVLDALKAQAAKESVSVNALVVRLLEEATGHREQPAQARIFHDLDNLFGTWSEEEYRELEANTACFGEIDPEQWGEPGEAR